MSATRRALSYAAVAGFTFLAGALLHVAASRQPVMVLIPDTLGVPVWPVCRLDTTDGRTPRLIYLPVTLDH